ncbi:hypothetical protein MLD38_006634 [Melastoma candidum]|uniref:Uncharacterized protein n=1 Tax=Melastoma candidum TaxID=119954 RepID=A0ACB9RN62_9MYRT|nr:hypothetical protein MLD38_006634 [Melastoma candidum]
MLKFYKKASDLTFDESEKQYNYETISYEEIHDELVQLKELTSRLNAPVEFAHNDLLCGNIMLNDEEVTTCHSAEDVLYLLRENHARYDVLITEIRLPGMSRFQLLEEALKLSDLPIILFSTDLDHDTVKEVICSGASYVLSKPISMDILKVIWQLAYHNKQTFDFWEVGSVDLIVPIKGSEEKRDATGISKKKQRYSWTEERHNLFVEPLKVLGNDKAVPSKICKYMQNRRKDPYLTRHVIASHLRKFRGMKSEKQSESPAASDAPYWRNTIQHTSPLMYSGRPSSYKM